jgi:hypothetical protein
MGVLSHVTAAKHALRRALDELTVNGGIPGGADRMFGHLNEIRQLCAQLEARSGKNPARDHAGVTS